MDKKTAVSLLVAASLLAGCAAKPDQAQASSAVDSQINDPFEGFNRTMWKFNYDVLDPYILRPLAVGWSNTPKPITSGIRNVLSNLDEPASAVNYLLQGQPKEAIVHFNRFWINSTFGLLGLVDVAGAAGMQKENQREFGHVLGHYGVGFGPYVMVPGYGSFTPRQDIGGLVDSTYVPLALITPWGSVAKWALEGIDSRADALDKDALLRNSPDSYILFRDAYFQNQNFIVSGGRAPTTENPNAKELNDVIDEID
ncbi:MULTISPECIES: MlaA family lipoprotein [Plesiomonas]|uniref:ABC transporter outer membrane lipoprotein n=2 Tax=Plesiomonas shigelloides TaxID=703 RepID=R8AVL1_PLESH|nr:MULTISPECIES: MlaA family lipoprotein [Plesiomonas]AVQ86974.1 phospholipid-binding lipoprotein MlaA [Plesiomonas shigelloides]EON90382.1 ABC transporter outer membrane lipoprotein [Plesiomonas shigelloides 302-73]KAB7659704.1 phospholipid-binding lipoprotein MlaA [Plesiomonas shigelloides]KAB7666573.1 phospholipid-binding lipoprotein MlaA [Plesiomonas shigelloides]KAB7677599.1 phospholipid-binding lipoprotein MlaA [Plesiomonas shigelloides]